MNRHPGGIEHTTRMLELSHLLPPANILDMGAGSGEAVELLRNLGYEAVGIDLNPTTSFPKYTNHTELRNPLVIQGNFLNPPFEKLSFDGIISQCAFYVSGQPSDAFSAAFDLLKSEGILMLSDICPRDHSLKLQAERAGFRVLHFEDQTPAWKEYYIEAIWLGTARCFPCNKKMNYEMIICKKP